MPAQWGTDGHSTGSFLARARRQSSVRESSLRDEKRTAPRRRQGQASTSATLEPKHTNAERDGRASRGEARQGTLTLVKMDSETGLTGSGLAFAGHGSPRDLWLDFHGKLCAVRLRGRNPVRR